jgi:hypothetical protein
LEVLTEQEITVCVAVHTIRVSFSCGQTVESQLWAVLKQQMFSQPSNRINVLEKAFLPWKAMNLMSSVLQSLRSTSVRVHLTIRLLDCGMMGLLILEIQETFSGFALLLLEMPLYQKGNTEFSECKFQLKI